MYILGGFDGARRNDMHRIAVIEAKTREEKSRTRLDPEQDPVGVGSLERSLSSKDASAQECLRMKAQILELQRRLEKEEERHICKICYEREINSVILNCAHVCLCSRCAQQVTHCPICRTEMKQLGGGQGYMETFIA